MSAAKDFRGDALLAGVDQFGLGHNGGDLLEVFCFDGITEDDSHGDEWGVGEVQLWGETANSGVVRRLAGWRFSCFSRTIVEGDGRNRKRFATLAVSPVCPTRTLAQSAPPSDFSTTTAPIVLKLPRWWKDEDSARIKGSERAAIFPTCRRPCGVATDSPHSHRNVTDSRNIERLPDVIAVFHSPIRVALATIAIWFVALESPPAMAGDAMAPIDFRRVQVGGEIGRRIDITINKNLLKLDTEREFFGAFPGQDWPQGRFGRVYRNRPID